MFNKDAKLRGVGEQVEYTEDLIREYIRCKQDIIAFSKHIVIETLDDGKVLFQPYEYQKKILKAFAEPPNNEKNHAILLMPRQQGKTTITTAYILHYSIFNANKNVFVIANKEKTAMEIMRRIQLAYRDLPMWLQQEVIEWNKSSIVLGNGTRITAATTSPDSISGQSVNLLYIDEFAKVPEHLAEEFITSTYPVISSGKTSKIIITSTPVGMNHFYEFWINAIKGKNNFYPIKVGWWEHPKRDKAWKEQMIRDVGVTRFAQEFGCRFLGSQDTVVDADVLEMMIPKDVVDVKYGSLLKIYEKPIPDEMYIMGVDAATGVGADFSVIQVLRVIDPEHMEQVAVYRYNRIPLHDFAQVCISVSQLYNNAQMLVENNLGGEELCNAIWYDYEYEYLINFDNVKLGIRATPKTKVAGVLNMKRYLENGWLTICDKETIDELSRFVERGRNKFEAGSSRQHDDLVMGLVWACYYVFSDEYKELFESDDDGPKTIDEKYRLDSNEEEYEDDEDSVPTQFFYSD